MSVPTVVVAGALGKLGMKITRELVGQGAAVRALVRRGTAAGRLAPLAALGVKPVEDDLNRPEEVSAACKGASCVVSALLGMREVMVDTQTTLLQGAIEAGVKRFIPSDYAMDFTKLDPGSNRNLDLHRDFQQRLDRSGVQATSILNGMFMELLTGEAPFFLWKIKRVLCWGDPNQKMDVTTMDDTAAFTARAALDDAAPRWLRIAGDQVSAQDLAGIASELTNKRFKVLRPGGLGTFAAVIKLARKLQPAPNEPFPAWQGMQYMHNMYEGKALMQSLDNTRYPGLHWTTVKRLLQEHLSQN